MRILGFIPARGGSKGVFRKNIKLLDKKPLIQYSIDIGRASKEVDRLIVSTEDEQIAQISKSLGAEVPFLRPQSLATDSSPTIDSLVYTVQKLKESGYLCDAILLLQPTSPFRSVQDIDTAVAIFKERNCDSLVSVTPVPDEYNPHWVFEETSDGFLEIATGENEIITRRQDLPKAYIRNGAIYITKSEVLLKKKSIYGKSIAFYVMNDKKQVNIDTIEDWKRAEKIINNAES